MTSEVMGTKRRESRRRFCERHISNDLDAECRRAGGSWAQEGFKSEYAVYRRRTQVRVEPEGDG